MVSTNKRGRRFQVALPLLKEVRLSLWAYTRGKSKTAMAEAILSDRVSREENWQEVVKDLKQEAALHGMTVEELIAMVLDEDGFSSVFKISEIKWEHLVDDGDGGDGDGDSSS